MQIEKYDWNKTYVLGFDTTGRLIGSGQTNCISTQFNSFRPIDKTLSGATREDLGVMAFTKTSSLLKPYHQIV